jgi:hypothetical protein
VKGQRIFFNLRFCISTTVPYDIYLNLGWEVQGLGPGVKVLRFDSIGGKRFEVQGLTCFFEVLV